MISVTVIALGKLKESYMRDFCAEYEKRLKAFCKININRAKSRTSFTKSERG